MWSPSQIAARRAVRRRPNFYTEINLWGFVSIMLALLFLFIGDTRPHQHLWVPVDLPVTQNAVSEPSARREDAIRVSITRDGNVYFRRDRINLEDLPNQIRTALREGAEKKVYVAADQMAKYAEVEVVFDHVRLAGITNVVILAEKSTH